MENSAKFEDLI